MRVVLDTNILLQSIARKSRMRPIWDAYLSEKFILIISHSILLEYEEKIAEKTSVYVAENVTALIGEAPNTFFAEIWYEWNAITSDVEDNKFFDSAIAGRADYIVTNDSHFKEAKLVEFPFANIISGEEFLNILNSV